MVDERETTGQPVIDSSTGKPRQKEIVFLQSTAVWNGDDIEGMPAIGPSDEKFSPIEAGEAIIARSPVKIFYGGNVAAYNRRLDQITLPNKGSFTNEANFYAAAAHEIVHSTGHESRLNREFGKRFGDSAYCVEELTAELGSVFLAEQTGLPHQLGNHASYIGHWLEVLRSDKKAIFIAAAAAAKAVSHVMGQPQLDATAEKAVEVAPSTPIAVVGTPVKVPVTDQTAIPTAIAVVAKLKERRSKQAPDAPSTGQSAPKM